MDHFLIPIPVDVLFVNEPQFQIFLLLLLRQLQLLKLTVVTTKFCEYISGHLKLLVWREEFALQYVRFY